MFNTEKWKVGDCFRVLRPLNRTGRLWRGSWVYGVDREKNLQAEKGAVLKVAHVETKSNHTLRIRCVTEGVLPQFAGSVMLSFHPLEIEKVEDE